MRTNKEIRELSKSQLKGNWSKPIIAALILVGVSVVLSVVILAITEGDKNIVGTSIGQIINLIVSNAMIYGIAKWYLSFARGVDTSYEQIFDAFKQPKLWLNVFLIDLLMGLIIIGGVILFFVPAIIFAMMYSMVIYIVVDNNEVGITEALRQSRIMMQGHKMQLFKMSLYLALLSILAILTFGIAYIWLIPYMYTCYTNFYQSLKEETSAE